MAEIIARVAGADRDSIIVWMGECAQDYAIKNKEKSYTTPCYVGTINLTIAPGEYGAEIILDVTAEGW